MTQRMIAAGLIVALGGTACERKPQQAASAAAATKLLTVTGFKTPESVKYDADLDLYFVTNINGHPTLAFVAGGRRGVTLNAPKGTAIVGDTLWVADIDAVRAFNKRTGAPVATVDLGKLAAKFLNDIAVGPDGALYVTDTGILIDSAGNVTHPGPDRIFRVGSKREVSVAAEGDTLDRPNGITWDAANASFVVVSFGGPAVFSWKPGDKAPTVIARGPGSWDGVEVLGDGRIIASSWADSSVDVVASGKVDRLIGGVPSPADIGLDTKRNRVLIPIFQQDRVEVWQLAPLSHHGAQRLYPAHLEFTSAAVTGHAAWPADNLLPLAAARAHCVAVTPARRYAHGVTRQGNHGPFAGRLLDDLEERGWHFDLLAADLDHGLERAQLPDAIPRATADLDVQVGLQARPLHACDAPPGRVQLFKRCAGSGGGRARTARLDVPDGLRIRHLTGAAVRWITLRHGRASACGGGLL